jgi:hypothetical protein
MASRNLVTLSLMVSNDAIYWAVVVQNTVLVAQP